MDTEEVVVDESELKDGGFEIEGEEVLADDILPEVDDVLPIDDDGALGEKGEEDEEAELFNEYLFGDDANAM